MVGSGTSRAGGIHFPHGRKQFQEMLAACKPYPPIKYGIKENVTDILTLNGVAPLVADPLRANSTITSVPIVHLKKV